MHDEKPKFSTELSEKLGYEDSDVSIPILLKWGVGLVILLVGTAAASMVIYFIFVGNGSNQKSSYPLASERRVPPPGVPQLQADPVVDIKKFRADEEAAVNPPGGQATWKDGDGKEAIRIPIDAAMEVMIHRGIQVQTPNPNDVTPPMVDRGIPGSQPGNAQPRTTGMPPSVPNTPEEFPVTGPYNHYNP